MSVSQNKRGGRGRLKTHFQQARSFDPIYTGGSVATSSDGIWLFTTLSDDVIITNIQTGALIARLTGDSQVTTIAATATPYDAQEGVGTLLVARRSLAIQFHPFPGPTEKPLKTIHRAHEAPILVSAADSTGSLFATGAADGSVKVWDAHQGHMTHVFRGHANVITALAFDVDPTSGRARLASASEDGQVRVWDLHSRSAIYVFKGHTSAVTALAFNPEAGRLVSGGRDAVLLVWDVTLPSNITSRGSNAIDPVGTIAVYETIEAAGIVRLSEGLSPNAKGKNKATRPRLLVYIGGDKGVVRFWDLATGQPVHATPPGDASSSRPEIVDILRLPNELVVIHSDHNLDISPIKSLLTADVGPSKHIIGFNDEVIDVAFVAANEDASRETQLAVATNSPSIRIYDLDPEEGFTRTQLLSGHTDVVLALARSASGRTLLSGSKDKTARLWQPSAQGNWTCNALLSGHLESVGAVALADDYAATASSDHTIKIWPLANFTRATESIVRLSSCVTSKIHDKDINSLDISPNGRMLASGSQDRTARLFSVGEGGQTLTPLGALSGHKRGIWSVRFSPVDRLVATASGDRTVKLWSVADFTCLKTFEGHTNSVLRVDFISTGQQLVSCASDGLVKVWNVRDEECVATLDNHEEKIWALAVSNDEHTIVSGAADSVITFWEDITAEVELQKAADAEDLVLKNQDYENFLVGKDFRSAFLLALSLDQPRRLHTLLSGLLTSTDRQTDSITGHAAIDSAVAALQPDMLMRLLSAVRDWNAISRTADIAQAVLHAVLKQHPPNVLLDAGIGGEMLDALLPYTERHFDRADRLLTQDSFALDYLLTQCDVFDEVDEQRSPMQIDGVPQVAGR